MAASWSARWSTVRRSRIVPVGLAIGVLAMPATSGPTRVFHGLTYPQLELVVLAGVLAGWTLADRLLAGRVSPWLITSGVVVMGVAALVAANTFLFAGPGPGRASTYILASAVIGGTLVRGPVPGLRSLTSLVPLATTAVWLTYDLKNVPFEPLRDLHLYLNAGADALASRPVYLTAPLETLPDNARLPFLYPPFTIPLFEVLASMPLHLIEIAWVAASVASAVASLWLLGVRGRWLALLVAWPPLAIGISVGNVAMFSMLLFVVGFRFGAALVLGGLFKLQSGIPSLWLVRERRWRSLLAGAGILLLACLITLPLVGSGSWPDWISGLGHFQATTERFPTIKGLALTRWLPAAVVAAAVVVAIVVAALARGRNGLARFGIASIVASPTLYIHGLWPILPGAFTLPPALLWFVLGMGHWIGGLSAWPAIGVVMVALLLARGNDLEVPTDLSTADRDLHPAGTVRQVWPDDASAAR